MNNEQWMPMPMYCPNCGNLNYGYQNNEGKIKYECTKCRIVFIRIKKGRRHDTISEDDWFESVSDYLSQEHKGSN